MEKNIIEKFELVNGQAIIDMNYNMISANEEMYRFIGISTNISFMESIHQVDLDDFIDVCHHLRDSQEADMVLRMRRSDNSYRWLLMHIARFRLRALNTSLDYFEITCSDILVLRQHYEKIAAVHNVSPIKTKLIHDDLIYTKDEAMKFCQELIDSESEHNEFMCVIAELDNFERYKTQMGEEYAAKLLDTAIDSAREIIGNRGIICKHDDVRFTVVVLGVNQEINMRSFLETFRNKISWNAMVRNNAEHLTLSLGVARYPQNSDKLDIVVKKLLRALDICHTRGTGKYIIYREHLHGEIE